MDIKSLNEIFLLNNKFSFEIPKYQRGYSWSDKELDDFLNDLVDTNQSTDSSHFFGTICITLHNEKIKIVDGQQRITTCAIFLICIRDFLYDLKDSIDVASTFDNLQQRLHKTDGSARKQFDYDKFILTLSRTNDNFFRDYIIPLEKIPISKIKKYAKNDSDRRLFGAYLKLHLWLKNEFESKSDEERVNALVSMMDTLFDDFKLDFVKVESEEEAYERFNLINNRGIPLIESDLIKNELFGKLSTYLSSTIKDEVERETKLNEYDSSWNEMRNNITGPNSCKFSLDVFFHNYLVAFEYAQNLKLKKIFSGFKKLIKGGRKSGEIINDLRDLSEKFTHIRNPSPHFDGCSTTQHYLKVINNINAIYIYSVLLAGYKNMWEYDDKKSFRKLVEICFKYHLRVKTLSTGVNLSHYQNKLYCISSAMSNPTKFINSIIDKFVNDERCRLTNDKDRIRIEKFETLNDDSNTSASGQTSPIDFIIDKLVDDEKYYINDDKTSAEIEQSNTSYSDSAIPVYDPTTFIDCVIYELVRDEKYYPGNDKVCAQLEKFETSNSKLAIALLEEIELKLGNEKRSATDVTLEHIMPKNIKLWEGDLETHLHDDVDDFGSLADLHAKYLNYLGNQTLQSSKNNTKNSNKPFENKLVNYKKSEYGITKELQEYDEWNFQKIKERQEKFAGQLLDILDLTKLFSKQK